MPIVLDIRPGDIFCTRNPMSLGKLIKWVQTFNSVDNSAFVSHSGIILNEFGRTYEALWTVESQDLYTAYAGAHVLVGRHRKMSTERFRKAYRDIVRDHNGGKYPFLRLPLMGLFPRLSKYLYWGRPVCSELAFKFLHQAGLVGFWKGVTPDYIADAIRNWRDFQIVYDGKLPTTEQRRKFMESAA